MLSKQAVHSKDNISRRTMLKGLTGMVLASTSTSCVPFFSPTSNTTHPPLGTTLYIYHGHDLHGANFVAWSPDNMRIASSGAYPDDTVQIWNAISGDNVFTYIGRSRGIFSIQVNAITWSVDGKCIATGYADPLAANGGLPDNKLQIWDAHTGRNILTYRYRSLGMFAVAWSPNGKHIASGGGDPTVQVWDAATGNTIFVYQGHSSIIDAVAWSPDSKRIVSSSNDPIDGVQVWDAITGKTALIYRGHSTSVNALAWSPNGKLIVSTDNKDTHVWDAATGKTIFTYTGDPFGVNDVAWSLNSKLIASAGSGVRIWSATTGKHIFTYRANLGIQRLAWSPDGQLIACTSSDNTVHVWQAV